MATWYCDYTNGDDTTGSGTSGAPWKTLQKTVNSATGGDTINIANTSAQVLAAAITWNTGWTADNSKYTTFQAWNNGGSLTIQRPDETVGRVSATLNGNGAAHIFSSTSKPQRVITINLRLTNTTDSAIENGDWWCGYGLEIDTIGNSSAALRTGAYSDYRNIYIHDFDDYGIWLEGPSPSFTDSYIDGTANSVVNNVLVAVQEYILRDNIIIGKGATTAVRINNSARGWVEANTVIGDSTASASAKGFSFENATTDITFVNNLIYKYNGAGASAYVFNSGTSTRMIGFNAEYDSNAGTDPAQKGADLTANDVTGSGDPFVNSAIDDYSVTGSGAEGAGLGTTAYSSVDIGAVQSQSGGGGGSATLASAWVG